MTPAEDFAEKADQIMKELVEPATRQPMRVWIDENLFAALYAQANWDGTVATLITSNSVELIKRVDWQQTPVGTFNVVDPLPVAPKSKNPMASQQAWKKKHRR